MLHANLLLTDSRGVGAGGSTVQQAAPVKHTGSLTEPTTTQCLLMVSSMFTCISCKPVASSHN